VTYSWLGRVPIDGPRIVKRIGHDDDLHGDDGSDCDVHGQHTFRLFGCANGTKAAGTWTGQSLLEMAMSAVFGIIAIWRAGACVCGAGCFMKIRGEVDLGICRFQPFLRQGLSQPENHELFRVSANQVAMR
jgi:hypothetical protein